MRPTSETIIGHMYAQWVQSYRDLPLLVNQWANVVRWELRPRLFLRTTEFLWQEGHTVHATRSDAAAFARRILAECYHDFMVNVLAIPVHVGVKTRRERFAGAINTMTCEAMMRDGKALQMGTSHELGQNFARAFDITYLDDGGQLKHCWTTSWGSSTRMVGGLIMAHGDDDGLRVPPAVAHVQAVVCVVRDGEGVIPAAARIRDELVAAGIRARLDDRVGTSFGRRVTDWELKGVPVRVEVGPRDLAQGEATLVRRDDRSKVQTTLAALPNAVAAALEAAQAALLAEARERRDDRTASVGSIDEAIEASALGFARLPWRLVGEEGEEQLARASVTVRCLQHPDGRVPDDADDPEVEALVARAY